MLCHENASTMLHFFVDGKTPSAKKRENRFLNDVAEAAARMAVLFTTNHEAGVRAELRSAPYSNLNFCVESSF